MQKEQRTASGRERFLHIALHYDHYDELILFPLVRLDLECEMDSRMICKWKSYTSTLLSQSPYFLDFNLFLFSGLQHQVTFYFQTTHFHEILMKVPSSHCLIPII